MHVCGVRMKKFKSSSSIAGSKEKRPEAEKSRYGKARILFRDRRSVLTELVKSS